MRLFLKAALFTAVVPGTVAVLVPLLLKGDRAVAGGVTLVLAGLPFRPRRRSLSALRVGLCGFRRRDSGANRRAQKAGTNGVYRYSRNPIYIAELTLIAGWAILFTAPIIVAYGVVLFVVLSRAVRRYEEPRLARQFGDQYAAYTAETGRWLPRLRRKDRP